jgi:cysteine sulfinate desulfinase/cysteine desulfurase-like protein
MPILTRIAVSHIITVKTEHKATLDTCREFEREGFEVTYLDVLPNGLIDFAQLESAMKPGTILTSVMYVNNGDRAWCKIFLASVSYAVLVG